MEVKIREGLSKVLSPRDSDGSGPSGAWASGDLKAAQVILMNSQGGGLHRPDLPCQSMHRTASFWQVQPGGGTRNRTQFLPGLFTRSHIAYPSFPTAPQKEAWVRGGAL